MITPYATPRPVIHYDKEKCGNAYPCRKCVEASNNRLCLCIGWMNSAVPDPVLQSAMRILTTTFLLLTWPIASAAATVSRPVQREH